MDTLSRGMVLNDLVLVMAADVTETVQDAAKRHDLWPTSAAALGRCLAVGSLMGSLLKDEKEKIEIQIKGDGPLGAIIVDGYSDGHVRGYVDNPHIYMQKPDNPQKLDVGKAVGANGYLRVMRDMGLKEPFTGQVVLRSGELGDDFAYYYAVSEQTPSVVSLGVLIDTDCSVKAAGGLIIQIMPGADDAVIDAVEAVSKKLPPISQTLAADHNPENLIRGLFAEYKPLLTLHPEFRCECSKEKFGDVLATLQPSDIQDMIEKDDGCETICHFCNAHYRFTAGELTDILQQSRQKD